MQKKIFTASKEFTFGSHSIKWLDPYFTKHFGSFSFEPHTLRTLGTFQTLPRFMNDSEIESELKPGLCELGDVLAFLDNAPEECKDGYANIFYIKDSPFVVGVSWYAFYAGWRVRAWDRGVGHWDGGGRVFSPATGTQTLPACPHAVCPSCALALRVSELEEWKRKVEKVLTV